MTGVVGHYRSKAEAMLRLAWARAMPRAARHRLLARRQRAAFELAQTRARQWAEAARIPGPSLLQSRLAATAQVRIAIYGQWATAWTEALGPESEIWTSVEGVSEIRHFTGAVTELEAYAKRDGPPVIVIPMMEHHALWVPDGLRRGIAPRAAIRVLADKAAFGAFAAERFADCVPPSFSDPDEARYPCVLKPTRLNGGRGVVIAAERHELFDALERNWLAGERVFLQGHVPGEREQALHAVCAGGKILWTHTFDKPDCLTRRDGREVAQASLRTIAPHAQALNLLEKIVTGLHYEGPLCMDYRMHDGVPKVFEINPRFGGTLMEPRFRPLLRAALRALLAAQLEQGAPEPSETHLTPNFAP